MSSIRLKLAAGLSTALTMSILLVALAQTGLTNATDAKEHRPVQIGARQFSLDDWKQSVNRNQLYGYELLPAETPSTTPSSSDNALQVYKQPSGWVIGMLREMFTDIDWDTIEEARVQIEKFIHRVEQLVGSVRNIFTRGPSSSASSASSASASRGETREGSPSWSPAAGGRWWGSKGDKSTDSKADATRVKEMLERVACFVGYSRLMNLSNEALAELDASKVVTSLFGAGSKRNSSGWKWWG